MSITGIGELPKLPDMSSDDGIAKLAQVIDALKSEDNEQMQIMN